MRIYTLPLQM